MTLFAEDIDDVGEIGLGGLRDDIRRGRPVMAHPHVERAAEPEREAALGLVELHRGNADVHHDAVDGGHALRRADVGEVGESVLDQGQPAVGLVDQIEPAGNRRPVAVDADDPGSRDSEDRAAVAAGAEGRVDIDAAVPGIEHLDRLAAENGDMAWRSRAHAPSPGVFQSARCENWTRTGPLRLKSLRFAGLFRPKSREQARLPSLARPRTPSFPDGICWVAMAFRARKRASAVPNPVRLFTT